MSSRELKALVSSQQGEVNSRLRSGSTSLTLIDAQLEDLRMDEEDSAEIMLELRHKLTTAESQVEWVRAEMEEKLQEAQGAAETALRQADEAKQRENAAVTRAAELEREVSRQGELRDEEQRQNENARMRAELDWLRQMEEVRQQFDRERERHRLERERDSATIANLNEELDAVKRELECVETGGASLARIRESLVSESKSKKVTFSCSATEPLESPTSVDVSGGKVSLMGGSVLTGEQGGGNPIPTDSVLSQTQLEGLGNHSDSSTTTTATTESSSISSNSSGTDNPTVEGDTLIQSIAQLVKTQTDMANAQTKVMLAQSLPPLPHFSGESMHTYEDGFDRWAEHFEERARLVGWSDEHRKYQLKMLLDKSAFQTYRLLPDSVKASYSATIEALKERFRPVDIEELRGIEFHQLTQGSRSIEQLGLELQRLAKRAFPTISGKDVDRLLKGRFFQALSPRWQRKLEAPKPDETFNALFNRARVVERREQQYAERKPKTDEKQLPRSKDPSNASDIGESSDTRTSSYNIKCRNCHKYGHIAKYCRGQSRKVTETPGKPKEGSSSSFVTSELTDQQLEEELAKRKLGKEQEKLDNASSVGVVTSQAVGPIMEIEVEVEGVRVPAVVDTGSQSTIISRSFLHQVKRHLESKNQTMPKLELPGTKFYGKSGKTLDITARVELTISVDGVVAKVPVFVQPQSEQACLLGSNALGPLGVTVHRVGGEVLGIPSSTQHTLAPEEARVRLVQRVRVPRKTGVFAEAEVVGSYKEGDAVVFERSDLEEGLFSHDSVVTVGPGNKILVPVHNGEAFSQCLEKGSVVGTVTTMRDEPAPQQFDVGSTACNYVQGATPPTSESRSERLMSMLNLPKDELTPEEYDKVVKFLKANDDVFALDDSELGCTGLVKHEIDTGDNSPVKQHFRRVPFVHREKISQMVDDMLEKGIIRPSNSPWASPIVLVPKKDGQLRFCVDYRKLNSVTKKDQYPLPRIEDIMDTLGGMRYFSTLDLASGYWQIEMGDEARQKSAFATHCGLHEFVRMPFGLCNAPATFQRLMEVVLGGMLWKSCFVYIDDVLLGSHTLDEHLDQLGDAFERLRQANLRLKPKKCSFLRPSVLYLGHVLSREGVSPDPEKVEKVKNYPVPTTPTEVRQFLGLASYYRRFMKGFSKIAKPLYALTCKDVSFTWSSECQVAFDDLKQLLITAPVLVYPQFGREVEFILETDASTIGLGAVLSQKQQDGRVHPIAYASRKLQPAEEKYAITELETLGIIWALKYFRPYLLGHKVVVYTDHVACTALLNCTNPSPKLARWAMVVQEMDVTIKHRTGKSNANADTLSRLPVTAERGESSDAPHTPDAVAISISHDHMPTEGVHSMSCESHNRLPIESVHSMSCKSCDFMSNVCKVSVSTDDSERSLQSLQRGDPDLVPLIQYLEHKELPSDSKLSKQIVAESTQFSVLDGVLHFDDPQSSLRPRIVVPTCLKETLLQESHGGSFAGHFAERKTIELLRRSYWWKTMRADVRRHCRACLTCASRSGTGRPLRPNLQPIPVGGPFNRVGVDVLQLPLSYNGNKYAIVFCDYLTKWPEVFPSEDQKAETIARIFVERFVSRHGVPEQLLSDRGPNFLSELIQEVCKLLGTKKVNTTGYHPQTDGLVERMNRTLISMLSKCVAKHGRDWDERLPYILFAYRATAQESTKESPFFLLYGRDPRVPTETALSQPTTLYQVDVEDYKTELVTHLSDAWSLAQQSINKAQLKQKKNYDKRGNNPVLNVGQRVMVQMPGEVKGKSWKFARPFHDPYRVISVTPTNAEVKLVDKPNSDSIFVSLQRIRHCYEEVPDVSWTGQDGSKKRRKQQLNQSTVDSSESATPSAPYTGPITRSRSKLKNV